MHSFPFRRLTYLPLLFALFLAGCLPGALPTAAPADLPATEAPSKTPPPTATTPPTATPLPSATPTHTPKPTATRVPPTATSLPSATPTATPGPGDVVYQGDFTADWQKWGDFYFGTDKYTLEPEGQNLIVNIDGKQTYVYSVYMRDFAYSDMQVDVDVDTLSGPNRNNLSVVCRYSHDGWYEFNIASGGLWNIFKYSEKIQDYQELKSGGSTAIKIGQATNHLTAVCQGDTLTLYINDVKVGSVKDKQFTHGTFGISASTFDLPHIEMRFSNFTVRLPDSSAALGQGVAPTVSPSTGSGSNNWVAGLYSFPLPGDSFTDATLQRDTLNVLLPWITADVPPGCQKVRVTSATFVTLTQPVETDAQGNPTAGAWEEQWVVGHCGTDSAFKVIYTINASGGVDFMASRLTSATEG